MASQPALTLDALEVLDAIDRKGSFAAAATALNRVPSAISYTVQKLEQDLGATLFQKQGRKSVLTNAGRHLVEQGRQLLIAAEGLAASTRQVATGWEPRLRIAQDHILPGDFLIPYIQQLYNLQPALDIEIKQEVLAGTWEALIEDKVDLIVGAVEPPPGHKGIRSIAWTELEMVFAAAPEHPICQQPQPLTDELVQQHRLVAVHDSSENLATINRGILNQNHFIYVPNMAMKVQMQCAGIGVGSLPRQLIARQLATGELVELQLENPLPNSTLHIAWKISNRGQALGWISKQLQQSAANGQTDLNNAG